MGRSQRRGWGDKVLLARDAIPDGYELPVVFFCFGLVAAVIFHSRWKGSGPNSDQRRAATAFGGIAVALWATFAILLLT